MLNIQFYRFLTDSGVLWNSATILCPDGRTPMATIAQGLDITNRKLADEEKSRLQTQLAHSQTLDSLGLLAGGVAHDMNNVLGAILGMATANLEAHPEGSPTYLAFEIIIKAAERGGKMVKSLLNFARQDPVEVSELDMNAILLEEVRILERTTLSKVLLKMDMASELRRIRGDASALSHAFMNLCINSVDAMSEKGTLTLRTRNVDNNWIEVVVEDTGVGMPKDILEKAMVPFFTTKGVGKGTGLGLSMVYSAVKAHNGQLDIQSEPGKGTQVRLRFPASDTILQTAESPATPPPKPSIMALKVLVVDDDELIRYTIQSMLKSMGHRVTLATSGEDALEKLEAGFQPDLIFLDMNMPGLGGAGTLPRLRALCPTLPVLLATGRVDQATLNLVAAHPYVTLMSKPFTMKELQKHLGH